jgi:hypothetical protein
VARILVLQVAANSLKKAQGMNKAMKNYSLRLCLLQCLQCSLDSNRRYVVSEQGEPMEVHRVELP